MHNLKIQACSLMIVTSLISNLAFADCQPAVNLNVGDKITDCVRVGVRPDVLTDMNKQLIENDFNKKILEEQKQLITLKDLRIKQSDDQASLWQSDSKRERENYDKERNRSSTSFWVGLGAGILITLGTAFAVRQVVR